MTNYGVKYGTANDGPRLWPASNKEEAERFAASHENGEVVELDDAWQEIVAEEATDEKPYSPDENDVYEKGESEDANPTPPPAVTLTEPPLAG